MKLVISLLNYNTKNLVKQCVKNITSAALGVDYEIIIVDNASADGSVDLIKKEILPHYPQVTLKVSSTNRGFGGGHNFALADVESAMVLIINPDITILDNAIQTLLDFMAEHPRCGIIGPQLIYPDLTIQSSCHPWPKFSTPLYRRTALGNTGPGYRELARYDMLNFDHLTDRQVDWLVGACLMIRPDVWHKIGGFDERFFLYYEDVDLCRSVWKLGYEVWYCARARVIHYHKRLSAQKKWWLGIFNKSSRTHLKSHWRYFWKYVSEKNRH